MQWCCTKNVIHVQYNTGWKTLQWPLHHAGHARSVRPTGQAQQQMVGHRPNKTKPGFHRPRIRLRLASTTGHSKQCSLCTNWPLVFSLSLSHTHTHIHTHITYARALTSKYSSHLAQKRKKKKNSFTRGRLISASMLTFGWVKLVVTHIFVLPSTVLDVNSSCLIASHRALS